MKQIVFLFLLVVTLLGLVSPVRAFEMRKGEDITIPKDTVVKGSLFAGGSTVTVDGVIDGDLYCGGSSIVISGSVTGDVICAGQSIVINGVVGGNIRSAGQLIDITGTVKRNVMAVSQTLNIKADSVIGGEVIAAGQTINVESAIGPGLLAAGQILKVNNKINGNVTAYVQTLSLGAHARVIGDLTYTSPEVLKQATGAAIVGKITYHVTDRETVTKPKINKPWMFTSKPWPQNALGSLALYLIVGAIVVLISPKKTEQVKRQLLARPWFDGFVGFLAIALVPMSLILFTITIIGIPVALLFGLAFAVMIILTHVYVAVTAGDKVLAAIGQKKTSLLVQMAAGVVIVELLVKLPFIGFLIGFIAVLWGLGGIILSFRKQK